jgi:hypothetical protein
VGFGKIFHLLFFSLNYIVYIWIYKKKNKNMKHVKLFEAFTDESILPVERVTQPDEVVFCLGEGTDFYWGIISKVHPRYKDLIDACNELQDNSDVSFEVFGSPGTAYISYNHDGEWEAYSDGEYARNAMKDCLEWYSSNSNEYQNQNPNQESDGLLAYFMSLGMGISKWYNMHNGGTFEKKCTIDELIPEIYELIEDNK